MFDFFKRKKNENKSSGLEPVDNWSNVVLKGVKRYDSLTPSERIWFNTRVLIDSTNDGGLISYYYNSGAENVYDAIEDIKSLGFDSIANLIKKYNEILFKGNIVPKDFEKRNKFIEKLDEQTDNSLQDIESDLTDLVDDLEKQLERFLKKEKLIDE
ncbi:MAG: DMP19 family protein [Prolixibacteraceae bacterium]|nr:DMP19 family protein [Prolixibacteraceae bacterium]